MGISPQSVRLAKLILGRVGLVLGFGILLLAGSELCVRCVQPVKYQLWKLYQLDPKIGWRYVPNHSMRHQDREFDTEVAINADGLRDRAYPYEKGSNTYRILVLGDSFAVGLEVAADETFSKVLEQKLNADSSRRHSRIEVLNGGVVGFGTQQEYAYLQELGKKYLPDLVLVAFYPNDVQDVANDIKKSYGRKSFSRHSFVLTSMLRQLKAVRLPGSPRSAYAGILEPFRFAQSPESQQGVKAVQRYLGRMQDWCVQHQASLLVVYMPMCLEIDKKEWTQRGLAELYNDDFFEHMKDLSGTLLEFGAARGIPMLSLRDTFLMRSGEGLYFLTNIHLSKAGHRVAAEAIYHYLREHQKY